MAYRVFKSPDGVIWQAWDVPGGDYPLAQTAGLRADALREGWLCFECEHEKRRLHPVPLRWQERSEEELWLYCRVAEPAAPFSRRMVEADAPRDIVPPGPDPEPGLT
jgi:hypothetical protein